MKKVLPSRSLSCFEHQLPFKFKFLVGKKRINLRKNPCILYCRMWMCRSNNVNIQHQKWESFTDVFTSRILFLFTFSDFILTDMKCWSNICQWYNKSLINGVCWHFYTLFFILKVLIIQSKYWQISCHRRHILYIVSLNWKNILYIYIR